MEIRTVRYARLYTLGNYQNERLEVEAEVMVDESPDLVLYELREWCARQSLNPEEAMTMLQAGEKTAATRRRELADLNEKLLQARKEWERIKGAVAKLGLEVPYQDLEDIPY